MGSLGKKLAGLFGAPSNTPRAPVLPTPPDPSDEAIKKAKLMERRRQLGLMGQGSTWLTGARGDTNAPTTKTKTLLGE